LHNLNYWQFGDYIGIGAGAHGKMTEINRETDDIKIVRRWKHRQPQQYIKQALNNEATSGQQVLSQQDIVFEFLLNALRLKTGCDIKTFENNTGLNYQVLKQAVINIDPDLLSLDKDNISTTDKGFLFLNEILEKLLED
jgi:oxygen-independent coproporphyrinogen-3 oxidase